jgi:amino acid transporter
MRTLPNRTIARAHTLAVICGALVTFLPTSLTGLKGELRTSILVVCLVVVLILRPDQWRAATPRLERVAEWGVLALGMCFVAYGVYPWSDRQQEWSLWVVTTGGLLLFITACWRLRRREGLPTDAQGV